MEPPPGPDDVTAHFALHFLSVPSSFALIEARKLCLCHLAMDQYVCNESNKYQGSASTGWPLLRWPCLNSHQHTRAAHQLASSTAHVPFDSSKITAASSSHARHEQLPLSRCGNPSTTECLGASVRVQVSNPLIRHHGRRNGPVPEAPGPRHHRRRHIRNHSGDSIVQAGSQLYGLRGCLGADWDPRRSTDQLQCTSRYGAGRPLCPGRLQPRLDPQPVRLEEKYVV